MKLATGTPGILHFVLLATFCAVARPSAVPSSPPVALPKPSSGPALVTAPTCTTPQLRENTDHANEANKADKDPTIQADIPGNETAAPMHLKSANDIVMLLCGPSGHSEYAQTLSSALLGMIFASAREGHGAAMEIMGIAGTILGRDDRAAAGWLELAALKERPTAMFLLSDMYARGRGRAVDGEAAMYWLQSAAEFGSAEAMMRMSDVMSQVGDNAKVINPNALSSHMLKTYTLSIHLSIHPSIHLSTYLSLSVSASLFLYVYAFV
jgi:hypothetical protein